MTEVGLLGKDCMACFGFRLGIWRLEKGRGAGLYGLEYMDLHSLSPSTSSILAVAPFSHDMDKNKKSQSRRSLLLIMILLATSRPGQKYVKCSYQSGR